MKTKLVYVITCAPEKFYLEQGCLSVFSARYHNPDAEIILIVDDKTDAIIKEGRDIITKYVTRRIVVSFDPD